MNPRENIAYSFAEESFEKEWAEFEGKDYMDREEFNCRMEAIEDVQEVHIGDSFLIKNSLKLFDMDIRRFIDPNNVLASRRRDPSLRDNFNSTVASGNDLKYGGIVQFVIENFPQEKQLVVYENRTFLIDRI